jgi:hypothetical protein
MKGNFQHFPIGSHYKEVNCLYVYNQITTSVEAFHYFPKKYLYIRICMYYVNKYLAE